MMPALSQWEHLNANNTEVNPIALHFSWTFAKIQVATGIHLGTYYANVRQKYFKY